MRLYDSSGKALPGLGKGDRLSLSGRLRLLRSAIAEIEPAVLAGEKTATDLLPFARTAALKAIELAKKSRDMTGASRALATLARVEQLAGAHGMVNVTAVQIILEEPAHREPPRAALPANGVIVHLESNGHNGGE